MDCKTHKKGGAIAILSVLIFLVPLDLSVKSLVIYFVSICGAIFGSTIPDIDHPKSSISREHKATARCVNMMTKHRGIVHTPLFAVILYLIFDMLITNDKYWFLDVFNKGVFIGYISHLVLDMLNPAGIQAFYPFSKKRFRIAHVNAKDGDKVIWIITALLILLFLYRL